MPNAERTVRNLLVLLMVAGLVYVAYDFSRKREPAPAEPPRESSVVPDSAPVTPTPETAGLAAWEKAAREALARGDYEAARARAREGASSSEIDLLLAEIDRAEIVALRTELDKRVSALHARAQQAIDDRALPVAANLLQEARHLIAEQTHTSHLARTEQAANRSLLRQWTAHDGAVTCLAFSPDGSTLVSGGEDQAVKIWDTDADQPTAVALGHTGFVRSVAFGPQGARAVSGSDDQTIRLWDAASGRELKRFNHGWVVTCVGFSPGGGYVFSGSGDKKVKLWEISTGRAAPIYDHGWAVRCLAVSADGQFLLTGGEDGSVRLWRVGSGDLIGVLRRPDGNAMNSLAFNPEGAQYLSGGDDGIVALQQVPSGALVARIGAHAGWVTAVAFGPAGEPVISGGVDGKIQIVRPRSNSLGPVIDQRTPIVSMAVHPNGSVIATGDHAGQIRFWRMP